MTAINITDTTDTNAVVRTRSTGAARTSTVLKFGAMGTAAAAALNAIGFGLGRAAGVDFVVDRSASTPSVRLIDVLSLTVMSLVIGTAAAIIANRIGRPSLRAMGVIGAVLAVATTFGDFTIDGGAAAKVILIAMHLVVGATYVVGLRRAVAATR